MSIDPILVRITASNHTSSAELGWMPQAGVSKRRCALDADEASFSLIFPFPLPPLMGICRVWSPVLLLFRADTIPSELL